MSHDHGSAAPRGDAPPVTPEDGVLSRIRRHFAEWAERYVDMRVRALER